jgi:tetratricopeptide (TPR) repeat protein
METKTLNESKQNLSVQAGAAAARCRTAKELTSIGEYRSAIAALGDLWGGIGQRPAVAGLPPEDQAELLLRVGALAGWMGSSDQIAGAQGFAKDLISEGLRMFETIDNREKIAEAQSDLALCYWREGAMDESRVWFRESLANSVNPANKLRIFTRASTVELASNRLTEALALLEQAAPLLDQVDDAVAAGCYHMHRAIALRRLGGTENLDLALIEATAASVHFERANHWRYFARCETNLGNIFRQLGRHDEALHHLDRARRASTELEDVGSTAQIDENRARVFIAQGRYVDAEKIAFTAASALEAGDEQSLLAAALETQGLALARLGRYQSSLGTLKRAAHIAESGGDPSLSGKIFLTILEEVKSFLSPAEIGAIYQEADERLGEKLEPETIARLRACARLAITNTAIPLTETGARGSFEEEVHNRESELIKSALGEANGSVTRAARILGLTHQGLCYIINHRHKHLLGSRAPIRVRRKSIIKRR